MAIDQASCLGLICMHIYKMRWNVIY